MTDLFAADALSPEQLQLLRLLLEEEGVETAASAGIPRRDDDGPAPLSFAQQRLWFADRLRPGDASYNVPGGLRLRGGLDVRALARTLAEVVRRHEALRTVFEERSGEPVQVVLPAAAVALPVVDLRGLRDPDAEARRVSAEEAARSFDLARGPLLRAVLLRSGAEEWTALFTLHHIVSDAGSVRVLVREVAALYEAFRAGLPSPLPELPVQYADYAQWQRERLDGGEPGGGSAEELEYWRGRLAGAPPLLELPTDRPRAPDAGGDADRRPFLLSREATAAVRALARAEGTTLFAALLAGFQALLARYAGQDDVLVGTPVAGRTRAELEGLIGFFVNTLVVRTDLSDGPTVRALLARVREAVVEAQAHQELPFERLVEALNPERSPGWTPLFQVLFTLDDREAERGFRLGDAETEPLERDSAAAQLDLGLVVADEGDTLGGWMEFRTALFDGATVERLLSHYARLLEGMAAAPDRRVREVPLTGEEERRALAGWGPAAGAFPRDRLVPALLADAAARTPDAPALLHDRGTTTHGELDRLAAALAARLRAAGAGPESRVGLLAERGPEMVAGVLAAWKAGAAYVPLDPAYPRERLAYMLDDAGVTVLLAREDRLDRVPGFRGTVVPLAPAAGSPRSGPAGVGEGTGADAPLLPGNLAYVIYTSGSTGRPKGVEVEHGNLLATLQAAREAFGFGPGDVMPSLASFAFDIWHFEVVAPLLAGAAVRLVPRERVADVEALVRGLDDATLLHAVPALMRQVVLAAGSGEGRGLSALRAAFVGGDAVPPDLLPEMKSAFPGAAVRVLYGPTEGTVICAAHDASADGVVVHHPLGRPLPGARLYVLAAGGDLLPAGVPGELCIAGDGVARGYLGRPDLTAERFVPDDVSGVAGGRLYRTGDRARLRPDGRLEFLGRLDGQVKVRGFRIETGEVEAALAEHPAVREAVVTVREDVPGDRWLVGYVVTDGSAPPAAELRVHLAARLPEYMVPGAFVALDALPLTPTGKTDRRALPAPDPAAAGPGYVAPRGPVEEVLATLWAELLGVERVGARDGFFEIGGHSLLATRVVSRVREAFGVEVPLRAIFDAPTVAELAARVEAALGSGDGAGLPPVVPVPRDGPLPLSFSQERLWFLDRLEPVNAHHNIVAALRLKGPLDAGALRAALEEVTRRHESLRTVFAEGGRGPVQVVLPPSRFPLPLHDISALRGADREAEAISLAEAEAGGPFDLERGPLFRTRLVRLAPDEHAFLLTLHHAAGDAWSLGVLFGEVSRSYAALAEGRASPLAPLPVQYADYAVWQREAAAAGALEGQVAWWREMLEDAPALLDLPTDRPRPAVPSHHAGEHAFHLPGSLADALRELGKREGVTLFMTLLAAWQVVLARWSGQDDVVVGTPVAGRGRAETEGLIGFFGNMLPLRTRLHGDPTFAELLGRVRETTLGAYARQDVPFERVLEALRLERSRGHSPVFQVMMVLHAAGRETVSLPGVETRPLPVRSAAAVVDLEAAFTETPDGLEGTLVYATDLFDEATAAALADHLRRVLEAAAGDAGRRLSDLSPLSRAERRLLLDEWNRTARQFPLDRCVHELFEAQAARTPDSVAVAHGGATLTYAELHRRVGRLARLLRARGVGPEARVAVCLERAPEVPVALLGVLRAGAAFVPLDPASPPGRIAAVLADSGARVLLTQARLAGRFGEFEGEVVVLDGEWSDAPALEDGRSGSAPDPHSAAYVIYTSGSTGTPKGVVVEHRSLANHALASVEAYGIGPGDRVLQFASLAFDASLEEIFPALIAGATVVLRDDEALRSIPTFLDRCEAWGVTVLDLPTAFWHELTAELSRGGAELPRAVRLTVIGGERALPERVAAWRALLAAPRLVNSYGPTEATVVATLADLTAGGGAEDDGLPATVSIGRPAANARAYVLDAAMHLLPVGARGELYLGGAGVARGYLGRPDLTAERFVPDPFAGEPGARLYRTGDRARFRRGGELEFAGRADQQVKIRGFRVEPGEVEAALARLPGIRDAAVTTREDEPGRVRLVAYVIPEREGSAEPEALRAALGASLPGYMVPSALVLLDALPLTPSGKLDRRALPEPEAAHAGEFVAPRTATERALADLWTDVLRVDRVGADDDFFALGGHSLLATRVVARVREAFGVELPLRAMLEAPTVRGVAEQVDALGGLARPHAGGEDDGAVPLSFAQRRLWFVHRLDPRSPAYNMPAALRVTGRLDVGTLRRCLGEVVRRHESLRTVFREQDGEPVQVVLPATPARLSVADLRGLAGEVAEAEAHRRAAEEAALPFDLERGPLLRCALLRIRDDEWFLLFTMHHIVSDGWSIGVLVGEVSALYEAFSGGAPSPLPPLPLQYPEFALRQHRRLTGEVLERQLAWWHGALAGAPAALDLPTDRPRSEVTGARGGSVEFEVSPAITAGVRALARAEGVTPFMVLLASWQALLGRWAGEDDVVVGSPVAGRDGSELEGLIGFFVNTLPLRADLSGDPSLRALLARVRETTLGAFAHQDLPFERLVEELSPARTPGRTPVFQVAFALNGAGPGVPRLGGARMEPVAEEAPTARFDLSLSLEEDGARYAAALTYRADLFEDATVRRMTGHFVRLLAAAAEDPDLPLADVPVLDEEERRTVLEAWNDTARAYALDRCVHERFEAQTARTPAADAVVWEAGSLSYAELDRRANRFARRLRRLGVRPEVRVGVYLERTAELVVAVLAILKAGGAYVPLDPAYPAGRVLHALEDSGAGLLVAAPALAARLPEYRGTVVGVDEEGAYEDDDGREGPPEGGAGPRNAAYVIYTSGSTGTPKGVLVEHRSLLNFLLWYDEAVRGPDAPDLPLTSRLSFDAHVRQLFPPLLRGRPVWLLPEETVGDPEALLAALGTRERVAFAGVPSLWDAVLERIRSGESSAPPGLATVGVGGEALSEGLAARTLEALPGVALWNHYGPTETTVNATVSRVVPGAGVELGTPVANSRVYLLDARLAPVPLGVAGELFVGGAGVARGYLGRPDLTAERFVPDPFSGEPGARMYRTGDRARRRSGGALEYLGRVDRQVKVRGFRIEPGEVEAALARHPGVRGAAVTVREDGAGGARLVGYYVPDRDSGPTVEEVVRWLSDRLPEPMVPRALVPLDALPLTPAGKTDHGALPPPEDAAVTDPVAPRTPVEARLAGVFAGVLGVERVGVHDDFFALGGHSLLATRLVSRVRAAFGVELPLRAVFEAPTVAGLAERLGADAAPGGDGEAPPLVPVPRDGALPLSFAQQRLWFLDRLAPGSAAYNMSYALRLRGALDPRALERALAELARRHETLRTVLVPAEDGGAAQSIRPPAPVPLPHVDLGGLPADARVAEARRLAADEAVRPFDLERGPLLRATRLRLAGDDHAVLFALHHVVSDGWSMGVLVAEVSALYAAFSEGRPSPLPPLPVQYADFAVWQRVWLTGRVLDAQLGYWRGRLSGAPPLLTLPTDRPRAPVAGERGESLPVVVPPEVAAGLRSLARRERATLFATLLAGWQLLLARWSGEEDVVVGSPVANRTRVELEPLIGFFVNTLALRTDLAGDPTLREAVGRARETVVGAQAHQDLPFERLVEEIAPERSLEHSPVFQVAFALQNMEQTELRMGTLRVEPLGTAPEPAKFDLSLTLAEEGDGLEGALSYRAGLFDAATVERLVERFGAVLAALAGDSEGHVSGLDLLLPDERRLLLAERRASVRPHPTIPLVPLLVEERARLSPDSPAVVSESGTLSYGALLERADALAARLRGLGVGPEVRVALCLERGPELVPAALAVLRAGGAYVPVDPAYPPERIAWLLGDSGAVAVLTTAALAERVGEFAGTVLLVDAAGGDDRAAGPLSGAGKPETGLAPENAAYVVYTSGSTGRPKGVVVPHAALLNLVRWHQGAFGVTEADRATLVAGPGFDASVWELWPYLAAGASLHPVEDEAVRTDPAALRDFLLDRGVTVAFAPTPLAEALLSVDWPAGVPLRTLLTGGDALRSRPADGIPFALVNAYGPTETAVVATAGPVARGEGDGRAPDLGRAVDNVGAYVLDRWLHPGPPGVPGELFVGGAGVARGYQGRPDLTAERFVPDPLSPEPGARAYRTGDRVRRLADGALEFLGRTDAQVKIRGFRIEPGEVEAVLAAAPGVDEAAVTVHGDGAGGKRLAGYVVLRGGAGADMGSIRAHLRERLPEYMVPSTLTVLETFPRTPNGKTDRAALPVPEGAGAPDAAPRTPTEEVLAGIWAEVLGRERVGTHDGFFDLGGHSLLATRVTSRVREAFGVELPLRALFEAPTVAGLAGRIDAAAREGSGVAAPPVVPVPRDGPLPLSFAQQRLWFIDQLEPGSAAYNVPQAMRLRGALDLGMLRRALGEVVRRHESLRTTFRRVDGRAAQVISPHGNARIPEVDLRGLPPAAREDAALRIARDAAERPFDLARGPLLRASAVRLGDEEFVLLLNMHHVVSDGWSMEVLVRELSALYAAFREGRSSPLAPLPVQYADFAVWQRAWLSGETLDRQLEWWRERLEGAPAVLEIPTDRPRPSVAGPEGASRAFALPAEAAAGLRVLSRRAGTTLFMTLLAGWQALLGRYAGRDDVVVGTPVAGRTRTEIEGLIGFFVNTLVVRTDLSGRPDVDELLRRVRETTLGAYAHQDLPFERLVEELGVERSLAHTPLFQATFSLRSGDAATLRLGDGEVESLDVGGGAAKFDLVFSLSDEGDRLEGALGYRTELWDAATVDRMLGHYATLLGAMAAGWARSVAELPLLPERERAQVLEGLNDTRSDYPAGLRVHDLFAAQARRTPRAPALSHRGATLSYADLDRRSARLAHHLRALGVGPESRVGVCLERTPDLVVALLAVLRAGGAYVPLDPAYPRERLGYMQEDAGVSLVLTSARLAPVLPEGTRTLALDTARAEIDAHPDEAPESGVLPENLSHVIFTSGSTGRPKGVMIRHASTVVLLHWLRENVSDAERSSVLFSTSINFDVSVAEVFGTLSWGGKLVLVENALELATVEEPVVHVSMVPTAAAELLRAGAIPASVRTLNLGGEPLPNDLAQGLYGMGTVEKVGNLYGPTEDTTYSTYSVVERGGSQVFVGRPVSNTQALVLDGELEPVPVGVVGELYLSGDGLSRGYAGRPDLTAERYLPNPYGAPGARMYRVLDRIRWRPDGELEYFGRTDFQVKVRGYRIELGEIETALRTHGGVGEAVVVVREDEPGDRRIVAYVVGAGGGAAPEAGELRGHVQARVPEYMVPSAYVGLEALPRTPNGKIDRRALPAPDAPASEPDTYVAPRTPTEEVLAGIYAEVLGAERVGAHADFFELGGHSLLATRVVSRAREAFGVEVPLGTLFEAPTVGELAAQVDDLLREDAGVPAPPIVPVPRDGELPLSFAQQRLWFIDQLQPGSAAYNIPTAQRIRGPLDVAALERALGELLRRHEALRTVFASVGGRAVQVVRPAEGFALPVFDLSARPAAEREDELLRLAREDEAAPFDLRAGPLLRARLVKLGDEEHALLLNMHHIVSDGWSVDVMIREVAALYGAFRVGLPSPLPDLPVQYADFAAWQRAWLSGEVLERQLAWWRAQLAGAPPVLEVPTDRPRPRVSGTEGEHRPLHLPRETARALRALSRREGATLYMTLMAAWQALLGRHAGQDDVPVGMPIAGRTRAETEGLIGFFVNTLVIRTDLSGSPDGRELVRRVRGTTLGAFQHQDVPFEKLVEELGVERSLGHTPLYQAVLSLRNEEGAGPRLAGAELEPVATGGAVAKFDLSLAFTDDGEDLSAGLAYRTDLFDAGTAERLLEHFSLLLRGMAASPEVPVSELPLMEEWERHRVLTEWNATGRAAPTDRCVHELFEAEAALRPEATALVFGDRVLTYAELDARADRLARHLRGLGVEPETAVGVCLERSAEMVVGLLGILKAGGAYVPLDPAYPADRVAFMLEDSGAPVLLTEAGLAERFGGFVGEVVLVGPPHPSSPPPPASDGRGENDSTIPAVLPSLACGGGVGGGGLSPANAAYVIYTSGSTGRPKGVRVEHRSLANLLWSAREAFGVRPGDVMPCVSSSAFDIWLFEALVPLVSGGVTRVLPRERAQDPAAFAEELGRVTMFNAVTPLMAEVVREVRASGAGTVPGIRGAFVGGEAVAPDLVAEMRAAFPNAELRVLYGPTEGTVLASSWRVPGAPGERAWRELERAAAQAVPDDARSIHHLFEAEARRAPDAVAVSHGGERVSYAELDARANRLARHLRTLGVGPEVRVGVCLERTPELVVALLATLKAGGAYIPLDPVYPADRQRFMLEDADARVLVTQARLAAGLDRPGMEVVRVDADRERIAAEAAEAPESGVQPDNLAYVIYTSGSTGRPKGVAIQHRSAVVMLRWLREQIDPEDRAAVLGSTSVSFDVSIAEIFGTLSWGGKLVLVGNALDLANLPAGEEVRVASMVPSAAAELLRTGGIPAGVRVMNLGGEALPDDLAQALYALGTVRSVGNLYGPSEDTTYTTYSVVGRGEQVLIGRPIANTQAYVLDDDLRPVPIGVAGELYLGGAGLARGYQGRPDMTADRFVPNPFSVEPGRRMYRTGDRIRWRPDGNLEYMGRFDHQVKVRGFRIEPGEIEVVLRAHPGVRDAVVIVREDTPGDRRLVAYLTPGGEAPVPPVGELRTHLRERLPEHMVPGAFVPMDTIPMTPNGKVDRKALPVPGGRPAGSEEYVAPRTPTEEALAAVWAEVLGIERVGAGDNFFELGGHSLLLVQLHARLKETLGLQLSVADLFQFASLADLARHLDEAREAEDAAAPSREETLSRADTRRSRLGRQRAVRGSAGSRPQEEDEDGEE